MIGAEDDVIWDAAAYIRLLASRLSEKAHDSTYETRIYEYGTHFVLPEGLMNKAFPGIGTFMTKLMFKAGRDFPKECRATRMDIDRVISSTIVNWLAE